MDAERHRWNLSQADTRVQEFKESRILGRKPPHSSRKAMLGSTRVARMAGIAAEAMAAAKTSNRAALAWRDPTARVRVASVVSEDEVRGKS